MAELAPDDKLIRVNGRTAREAKDILLRNLATVIEARATDIVEFVQQEIKDSGFAGKLAYGIVLTGGSAKLKDLDELFRRVTGLDVRVALPESGITESSKEKVADPAFSTVVGLLIRGSKLGGCAVLERPVTAAAPQPAAAPAPEPRQPYVPTPPAANTFHHVPPRTSQPAQPGQPIQPQTPPQPSAAEPVQPSPASVSEPEEPRQQPEPRRKRDWGSIFQKTFDKINKSFSAAEDEEI